MTIKLLSQFAAVPYFSWPIVFIIRFYLNYHIYEVIGKEEMQGNSFERYHRGDDNLLAIFTFRWSSAFMEDEEPETLRLMRISNVLNIAFIVHTILVVGLWMFLYGK